MIDEETFGTVVYLKTENDNKESFIVYGDNELRWVRSIMDKEESTEFENLTNEQLNDKCMEYLGKRFSGSRKTIIEKLKVAKRNYEAHEIIARLAQEAGSRR